MQNMKRSGSNSDKKFSRYKRIGEKMRIEKKSLCLSCWPHQWQNQLYSGLNLPTQPAKSSSFIAEFGTISRLLVMPVFLSLSILILALVFSTSLANAEGDLIIEKKNGQKEKIPDKEMFGDNEGDEPVREIVTDLNTIPFPARKMRELLLEAAKSGDVEKLRPYLGYGDDVTMLSLGGVDGDPIEFLKSLSGDDEGHEILAIMTEILEFPPVKSEQLPGEAIYIWPYFYSFPFKKLTPEQRVQMYRIITHGDFEEMAQFGSYIFYRLGITPEGRWRFFVAGD